MSTLSERSRSAHERVVIYRRDFGGTRITDRAVAAERSVQVVELGERVLRSLALGRDVLPTWQACPVGRNTRRSSSGVVLRCRRIGEHRTRGRPRRIACHRRRLAAASRLAAVSGWWALANARYAARIWLAR